MWDAKEEQTQPSARPAAPSHPHTSSLCQILPGSSVLESGADSAADPQPCRENCTETPTVMRQQKDSMGETLFCITWLYFCTLKVGGWLCIFLYSLTQKPLGPCVSGWKQSCPLWAQSGGTVQEPRQQVNWSQSCFFSFTYSRAGGEWCQFVGDFKMSSLFKAKTLTHIMFMCQQFAFISVWMFQTDWGVPLLVH